ncbi:hypothetical protein NTE19_003340 [Vibrio fluvialis]|nr:hypothetical protein [Vibrio fluvialis]
MPQAFKLDFKENGLPKTKGLSPRQWLTALNQIQQRENERRRHARVIPRNFSKLTNKQLAELHKRNGGLGGAFTRDDLMKLHQQSERIKKKYGSDHAGITILDVMANSRTIDIKRANNTVSDGSGIKNGSLIQLSGNILTWSVDASDKNGADHHRVRVRLEGLDDAMNQTYSDSSQVRKAAMRVLKDNVSFDCGCGRHQYWYRYLATIGNYAVAPPKEFSPPAQTNKSMTGCACKHTLYTLNRMRAPAFANRLAALMSKQLGKKGFADDKKNAELLTDKEVKAQRKGKQGKIDVEAINKQYQAHKKRLAAFIKKKRDLDKQNKDDRKELAKARRKATNATKKADQLTQDKRDLIKMVYGLRRDQLSMSGTSKADILKTVAKEVNVSVSQLESIING